jgi:hypothetical protein
MYTPNPYYRIDVAKVFHEDDVRRAQEAAAARETRTARPEKVRRARTWFAQVAHRHVVTH